VRNPFGGQKGGGPDLFKAAANCNDGTMIVC